MRLCSPSPRHCVDAPMDADPSHVEPQPDSGDQGDPQQESATEHGETGEDRDDAQEEAVVLVEEEPIGPLEEREHHREEAARRREAGKVGMQHRVL